MGPAWGTNARVEQNERQKASLHELPSEIGSDINYSQKVKDTQLYGDI